MTGQSVAPLTFLLTTWEGGGSVAPALTVARRLVARGHRVRVMSDRCNEPGALAVGAEFVAWSRAPSRDDRDRESDILKDWEHEGPDGLRQVIEALWIGRALDYARDVIEELRRAPADLVVTSEMLFGVAAGCEALGQRFACLTANVSLFPLPGVPPLGPGLPPACDDAERAMHEEGRAFNVALFDHGLPTLNAARATLGLPPLAHSLDQFAGAERTLIGVARAFDFAPDVLPADHQYVGPQLDEPDWAKPWTCPFPTDDRRPLVLAAFSTTFQNHAGVLQRVIDAAAALPVRLVVTLGGSIRPEELRPADNVRLVESAPHDAVMREAALVVTHGGHGTVSRALVHRRPMLVIPHGRDQNDNAVRVSHRGAGLSLSPGATTEEIGAALSRLLFEPAFAAAADALGAAVAREAQATPVAELLEGLAQPAARRTDALCLA
jgi:MGT family glycosyltransferase